jgi:hypothetical protein
LSPHGTQHHTGKNESIEKQALANNYANNARYRQTREVIRNSKESARQAGRKISIQQQVKQVTDAARTCENG